MTTIYYCLALAISVSKSAASSFGVGLDTVFGARRGLGGSDEWQKEGERLVKELSAGAQGEEGTKLVSLQLSVAFVRI